MKVKAPGRICLFGEHQDYLGFPIIAAAINRYIYINSESSKRRHSIINLPDINKEMEFNLRKGSGFQYDSKRDYLKSAYNVLQRKGYSWDSVDNQDITISGNIPINAGASSSSALVIAWLSYLTKLANEDVKAESIAFQGYQAEVLEFEEGGGMMDHYTCALGGLIYMETAPEFKPERLNIRDTLFEKSFILINSQQKKETVKDLIETKKRALRSFKKIKKKILDFDKYDTPVKQVLQFEEELTQDEFKILIGNLKNRDLTQSALKFLKENGQYLLNKKQKEKFGDLLLQHHKNLADNVGVSTPKIDRLIEFCMDAGAYGGKINGSGFGGTLFVYCPDNYEHVVEELNKNKIEHYPIEISSGVSIQDG